MTSAVDAGGVAGALLGNVRGLLGSSDARTRVRAIHHLATGVAALERQVLREAQASGMSWADIADVYGVSRQAVHRRFSDATVATADFFEELLHDLDQEPEVVPTLADAAKRTRYAWNRR